MTRIGPLAHTELIADIFRKLPKGIVRRFGAVPFVIGESPGGIGLHRHTTTDDGRSYSTTSHVCWSDHQLHLPASLRETSVVLLAGDERDREVILHELGHVLDDRIYCDRPRFNPLNIYAAINSYEAFATAFQSWAVPEGKNFKFFHTRQQLMEADPSAVAFFDQLAAA